MKQQDPAIDSVSTEPVPTVPSAPGRRAPSTHPAATVVAMGCFAVAFLMTGGACYVVLGWPAASDPQRPAVAARTLAVAMAFAGTGLLSFTHGGRRRRRAKAPGSEADPTGEAGSPFSVQRRLDALGLTDKEYAVALLILQHRSYKDIAEACGIAPRTVQFHASNVFHKTSVSRRRDFERLMLEVPLAAAARTDAGKGGRGAFGAPVSPTPPCAFPECAVCQHENRMACLGEGRPGASGPRRPAHVSAGQPKGNGW